MFVSKMWIFVLLGLQMVLQTLKAEPIFFKHSTRVHRFVVKFLGFTAVRGLTVKPEKGAPPVLLNELQDLADRFDILTIYQCLLVVDNDICFKKVLDLTTKCAEVSVLKNIEIPDPNVPATWEPKSDNVFQICLKLHNIYRYLHYTDEVAYDDNLNKVAQDYADKLIVRVMEKGEFGGFKRSNTSYGENLVWIHGYEPDRSAQDIVRNAVHDWYMEVENFKDFGESKIVKSQAKEVEHFTQVVWRATKFIGLGYAKGSAPDGRTHYVVVVNYDPPGNVDNQYKENIVQDPPTIDPTNVQSNNQEANVKA